MHESRRTLRFRSDSGREYLYDDASGLIFAWSPSREAVLEASLSGGAEAARGRLETEFGRAEVEAGSAFVRRARDEYGAFVRAADESACIAAPSPGEVRDYVSNNCRQLVLGVTEDCNLRCTYCVYSGTYIHHRNHTARSMTDQTAIESVNWFVELVGPQITRNPRKMFGLSFYGGEPFLNFDVIRKVLDHVRKTCPGLFYPVVTTNGTLMTPEKVRILVDHDVGIAVSLDGPQPEHDRRRVDIEGRGSYERVLENLDRLRREYPDYWRKRVYTSCVFDWRTDLASVARFFEENAAIIPAPIFVTQAGVANTTYYERFSKNDRVRCQGAVEELRQVYKRAMMRGESASPFITSSVGMAVMRAFIRPRMNDHRPTFLPYTGTCVPGVKVAVRVDGILDMCERTNGTYPIGSLAQGGIDYERVAALIGEFQQKVICRCRNCPISRLCDLCFSTTEGKGGVGDPGAGCSAQAARARQSLADYVSIVERNRTATFVLESDNVVLERRALFFS